MALPPWPVAGGALVSLVAGLLVAALLARLLCQVARLPSWLRLLDRPNPRSLHQIPVPRTGGFALLAGLAVALVLAALLADGSEFVARNGVRLTAIGAALFLVGGLAFLDDWRGLARRARLAGHLLAGLLLAGIGLRWDASWLPGGVGPLPVVVALPLTVLFVAWMVNLYNFMDGMDGLAASMAGFGFAALAVAGLRAGEPGFALLAAAVAAGALGFLRANFPPARLFLGDLGSSTLGLLAAALALWGANDGLFPLWAAVLAFSPFIVDASVTLARRAWHRERLWEAHRSHHYQRLVLAGWSHRRVLLWCYPLMAGTALSALAAPRLPLPEQWQVLLAWTVIYVLVHWRIRLVERAAGGTA